MCFPKINRLEFELSLDLNIKPFIYVFIFPKTYWIYLSFTSKGIYNLILCIHMVLGYACVRLILSGLILVLSGVKTLSLKREIFSPKLLVLQAGIGPALSFSSRKLSRSSSEGTAHGPYAIAPPRAQTSKYGPPCQLPTPAALLFLLLPAHMAVRYNGNRIFFSRVQERPQLAMSQVSHATVFLR